MAILPISSKSLSFEWDEKREVLEIHTNQKGLEALISRLQILLNTKDDNDHMHMMTPEWGGEQLTSERQNETAKLINHVKIFRWK